MCWNGNTFPFFLFEGQRVVELFPTGIQITDKIPAGSHGLFPRDFSFACRCGVVVMALVEVAGFSLLLPLPSCRTSFQSLALCPGGGRQCGGFPFLHLLYDCFPAGLITISTAVRTGPFQHFPVCFPRLWSSSATASFTACGSGATLIAMRILDSISRRYSSSISSSVMYTQRKAMSAL